MSEEHSLHLYATDGAMGEHARRSNPDGCPSLHQFIQMDMDERWVDRSPQIMLETFHWFRGEGFEMIIEDLLEIPPDRGVVVEGFRLIPSKVQPLLADSTRAVWLLPTPAFREAVLAACGLGFLSRTSNPERALANLLDRDRMFTECLRAETAQLGLHAIDVQRHLSENELVGRVASLFGLAPRQRRTP